MCAAVFLAASEQVQTAMCVYAEIIPLGFMYSYPHWPITQVVM